MARCDALLLLLLFWVGALRGAQEGSPPADLTGLNGTLELMVSRIGKIVTSAMFPPIDGMDGRLSGLQVQLNSVQAQLEVVQSQQRPVRDCSDLPSGAASGVHILQPGLRQPVPAYCDMATDGGGWTLIQRRADIQPRQELFLGWESYKWGFGALDAEFWLGLEYLFQMTSLLDRRYQIRFDLEDFDGETRYALYQGFRVASEEDGYRVTAINYTGNAGDSFSNRHSGQRFSTKDHDQENECAKRYKGGWWYGIDHCHHANLNGRYLSGNHTSYADGGVNWHGFRGYRYSLKSVEMKIKPSQKL